LEVEAVVEPADHRGVVFSLLQVVRCLLDELACLFGKQGNRRRHGPGDKGERHHHHQGDREPSGQFPVDQPRCRGLESQREKERHTDQHQHPGH